MMALDIISQAARCATPAALKPLLPAMVQALLEGLSSLEDARYVALSHWARNDLT
jgi:hypothetical protein